MGIGIGSRCNSSPYAIPDSNPNPSNFFVLQEDRYGDFLVLLVRYPNCTNCTNYEGKKLLVYKGFKNSKQLLERATGRLDPHFSEGSASPIARFKPCAESIELIKRMVQS